MNLLGNRRRAHVAGGSDAIMRAQYKSMVGRASSDMRPYMAVYPAGEDGTAAEIDLYGPVCESNPPTWLDEGLYLSLQSVREGLASVRDAPELTIRLYSTGGDVFAGMAIHDELADFPGKTTAIIHGVAASAGSVIASAADVVKVLPSTMVMIHNASTILWGDYSTEDIDLIAKDLAACNKSMRAAYASKCKKTDAELDQMMAETTWFVGQEAVDAGFADELIERDRDDEPEEEDEPPAMSADGRFLMVAGVRHPIADFGSLPSWLAPAQGPAETAAPVATAQAVESGAEAGTDDKEEEVKIENVDQLREQYPDLVAQVSETAAAAERARIQEIDGIAGNISDPDMVTKAKFEEPIDAKELLYMAAKSNGIGRATTGSAFLAAMSADGAESKVTEVTPDPSKETEGTDGQDDEDPDRDRREEEADAKAAEMFNKVNGRIR